jgi:hypothetical protein
MPVDWHHRWPKFALHLESYKRIFKANKYHDAPDVLTGIIEMEFEEYVGYNDYTGNTLTL